MAYSIRAAQLLFFSFFSSFYGNCSHKQGTGERSNAYGIPTTEKWQALASHPPPHSLHRAVVSTVLQPCQSDVHRHALPVLVFAALDYPHSHSDGCVVFPGRLKPARQGVQSLVLCWSMHKGMHDCSELMLRGRRIHV